MSRAIVPVALLLLSAAALSGCLLSDDDDDRDSAGLVLAIAASEPSVAPTEFARIDVSGVNAGKRRVVWGRGSSSCQFSAIARVDGKFYHALDERACTDDLAEQGLDPGRSRAESWTWNGLILKNGGWEQLPAGVYTLYAAAGDHTSRHPVTVRVFGP